MLVSQDEQHIEVYRCSMGWKQECFAAGQTVKLEQLDLELPVGPILECEPATCLEMGLANVTASLRTASLRTASVRQDQRKYFVLRFASAGSKGSIYEGVL